MMNNLDIMRRAFRGLLSAKARTLLTALAIAVGAFALSLTLAASNGANSYADSIIKNNFDPSELIVSANNELFSATDTSKPKEYTPGLTSVVSQAGSTVQFQTLSTDDISVLKGVGGVESVRTVTTVPALYITRDGMRSYTATLQPYSSYRSPELASGTIGSSVKDDGIILPEGYITSLGFKDANDAVGKKVRIAVKQSVDQAALLQSVLAGDTTALTKPADSITEQTFTIQAVNKKPSVLVQPGAELYITVSEKTAEKLLDTTSKGTDSYQKYLSVYVKVKNGQNAKTLSAVQSEIQSKGYGAQSVADTQKIINQVISVLQGIVLVFGLIAVVASIFGVVNTMYISVLQRTREIGLMKALGMRKRSISRLFLIEAGLLGLLGGLIGSVLAVVLGTVLNPTLSDSLGIGDAVILQFDIRQIMALLGALTVVAMIAGLLPAKKAARLDPIEALRTE